MGILLLIFIGIPLLEMMILIKLGEVFGFWTTLSIVVITGLLGAFLARLEGLRAWLSVQKALNGGQMPGEHMLDAFLILIAGALLITPGLLTDVFGFFLLIPWTRYLFKRWLRKRFDDMIRKSQEGGSSTGFHFFIR